MEPPRLWQLYAEIEELHDRIEWQGESLQQLNTITWNLVQSVHALRQIIEVQEKEINFLKNKKTCV